jgi:hypothetical protein
VVPVIVGLILFSGLFLATSKDPSNSQPASVDNSFRLFHSALIFYFFSAVF